MVRNTPYAGGFVTRHYGKPQARVHCLQIEINRHIYMDESRIERRPALKALAQDMRDVVTALGTLDPALLNGKRQRSEEHTSELQSLMRISYAVFCLNKKKKSHTITHITN